MINKLKTLKDFEFVGIHEDEIIRLQLKTEAIKDIKALTIIEALPTVDYGYPLFDLEQQHKLSIINYIKWKNNITEKDLK